MRWGCAVWVAAVLGLGRVGFGAERFSVEGLGAPVFADREVSRTFALPPARNGNWRLELSVAGTASNHVEVALGTDSDGNGVLEDGETSAVVGWACGEWFVLGGEGLGGRWTAAPASSGGGMLVMDIRTAVSGVWEGVSFRDGGGAAGLGELGIWNQELGIRAAPAWLNPAAWDAARVTARGAGDRGEAARVSVFADGAILILK